MNLPKLIFFSYRLMVCVVLAVLTGCSTQMGAIQLQSPTTTRLISTTDQRNPKEVNGFGIGTGTIALCANHGRWTGIVDRAFTPQRLLYVQAHLSAEFSDGIKEIALKRFQNCYQLNSLHRGAVLAAVSIPAAIALNSTAKGPDLVLAHIEVLIDGEQFEATSVKSYTHIPHRNPGLLDFETKENAAANIEATEEAMKLLIAKIRARKK